MSTSPADAALWRSLDAELNVRLAELADEGRQLWHRFDDDVRRHAFHSFVPADYDTVLRALLALRAPGTRFLEWGSATGVITIMADLLGFDACGIEIDRALVRAARRLATRYRSAATFATGSFLPPGCVPPPHDGEDRPPAITAGGRDGYAALGRALAGFDVVYCYPWPGEEQLPLDIMRVHGGRHARLLLYAPDRCVTVHRWPFRP